MIRSSRPKIGGSPCGQPVDRAEVEHAEPPVGEQPEVARMRVGVQQPRPGGTGEQEPGEQDARPVPLRLADPSLMIFDSGVPSIHSVTARDRSP